MICSTAVLTLALAQSPIHAAVYKCVGADGSTTYNDAPCAADQSAHLLSKSARKLEVLDCRIARNFAFDAVARMRQDDSATEVFAAYGGATNISEGARELINYVYSFQNNGLVSSVRIVNLAIKRCQAGLIDKTLDQCETFPEAFVTRMGGCISARQNEQTTLIQSLIDDDLASNRLMDDPQSGEPTLNAAKPIPTRSPHPETTKPVSAAHKRTGPPSVPRR